MVNSFKMRAPKMIFVIMILGIKLAKAWY